MGLGSAAVLAVYAAGFERTRAAAARFNDEAAGRRSAAPIRTTGEIGALTPRAPDAKAAPAAAPSRSSADRAATSGAAPTDVAMKPVPKTSASVDEASRASTTTEKPAAEPAAAPVSVSAAAVTPPAAARDSAPAQVKAAELTVPSKPAAAPADTAQSEKAAPARKDGTYTGWGTSRHGDIQATVQIREGKIVFAAITECLTRYSCSWIAALPPQVLARQSADVDFVSGATESTNAFYYAVVEALNKAK
jgi:uncharacterized protein with FMN-binding domain